MLDFLLDQTLLSSCDDHFHPVIYNVWSVTNYLSALSNSPVDDDGLSIDSSTLGIVTDSLEDALSL